MTQQFKKARFLWLLSIVMLWSNASTAIDIYVSTLGNDEAKGTIDTPFHSIHRALLESKNYLGREAVTIWFSKGDYYIENTIVLDQQYAGTREFPFTISALPGADVTFKGSKKLHNLNWEEYQNGMYVAQVPKTLDFDQLFINEERQIRARFPNYDHENPLRGGKGYVQVTDGTNRRYDEWFSYNPASFAKKEWKNPKTGIVHAFQSHNWGNMQYAIEKIDHSEKKVYLGTGGWQLQRRYGIGGKDEKGSWYFIENIFEELDTPGEWFLDRSTQKLYYYPLKGTDLKNAMVEVPVVKNILQLEGTKDIPVKHINLNGIRFTQSKYTFMDKYEPLARGDWTIHRGGAIFLEGTEHIKITDCAFEYVGGNGVFMSGYNRDNLVNSCQFVHTGESAVCFVGLPKAVRFYQTWDDREILNKDWDKMREGMDLKSGPRTDDYPKNCAVENSIMHDFGNIGKQVAGVFISMSHKIKVSHNTIYNCPRAGICINDGTWGGHVIEHNDIWETVQETGEHGPFNSWGRERQWRGSRGKDDEFFKELTKLDAIDNVILRNNRIANYRKSISAGNWTIDLDDGSSYFEIYNNLNLGSTIKLRDGMARKVYNNITVSAVPLGWHVWPKNSQDEIYKNIFVITGVVPGREEPTKNFIRPVALPKETKWSLNYDNNLYWNINYPKDFLVTESLDWPSWQKEGYDKNSIIANPMFENPKNGNYQVQANSPAIALGFENFPMDDFGHKMTRIVPFGGEFEEKVQVKLLKDENADEDAKIFYTLDGTEPTIRSLQYTKPIEVNKSLPVTARTINNNGHAVGFTTVAQFKKVLKVIHPSWLQTLLNGRYAEAKSSVNIKTGQGYVLGALLINIAEDPDLIDATGGYDYGCYIKSLEKEKATMWSKAGLAPDWVIQQINGEKVQNIEALLELLEKYKNKKITIGAVRDYASKSFQLTIPNTKF